MNLAKAEAELRRSVAEAPRRIVAVDLDGTLAGYDKWRGYTKIGKPNPDIIKLVRTEKREGAYILIHTARTTTVTNKVIPKVVVELERWLDENDVPYDEIWLGTGKPYASVYIDDKAMNVACGDCRIRYHRERKSTNERLGINGKTH